MLTFSECIAYADFFARVPSVLIFITAMTLATEYLILRGYP